MFVPQYASEHGNSKSAVDPDSPSMPRNSLKLSSTKASPDKSNTGTGLKMNKVPSSSDQTQQRMMKRHHFNSGKNVQIDMPEEEPDDPKLAFTRFMTKVKTPI